MLEKKIAALEVPTQKQPRRFIHEDGNGICENLFPCDYTNNQDDLKYLFYREETYPKDVL